MNSPLPSFYYDILARIVPGAVTLAVLWPEKGFRPFDWFIWFVSTGEHDGWEKLIMPILLVGVCYAIGVIFEVIDYAPDFGIEGSHTGILGLLQRLNLIWTGIKEISSFNDDRAFCGAVRTRGSAADRERFSQYSWMGRVAIGRRRSEIWDRLTYAAGTDERINPLFVHCHRFQSEQKMFQHLIYPALLFEGMWIYQYCRCRCWYYVSDFWITLVAIVVLVLCCRARCRRRWLQTVTFSEMIATDQNLKTLPPSSSVEP